MSLTLAELLRLLYILGAADDQGNPLVQCARLYIENAPLTG